MKIYENPVMNISLFEAENVATNGSSIDPGKTAFGMAQDAALGAVGNNADKVFNVQLTF